MGGAKRLLELVGSVIDVSATIVAGIVTLGAKGCLSTPVDRLIRLPSIGSATAKAKRLEVHTLEGNVTGKEN